jgi:hypothetical protein
MAGFKHFQGGLADPTRSSKIRASYEPESIELQQHREGIHNVGQDQIGGINWRSMKTKRSIFDICTIKLLVREEEYPLVYRLFVNPLPGIL